VQSGLGATVAAVGELPARVLELFSRIHPDLVNEPEKVFAQAAH
jgi:hypothetical protein